jgi:hypothetical protein
MLMSLKTISWFESKNQSTVEKIVNEKERNNAVDVKITSEKIILGLYIYKNLKAELFIAFYNKVIMKSK